jgi:signal transduction histidine kinase
MGYEVSIADNGIGIPDAVKASLFDTSRRFGGLGLHTARYIVEKYNGRIEVHDRVNGNPGQGAEFRIWIPKPIHGIS